MVITYYGGQFVKIQQGETVIAVNPFSKASKKKNVRFGANLALVSLKHPDYNGVENLSFGEKAPFVISGPGEYEVGGITVSGFASSKSVGAEERINTIYALNVEGVRVCILGAQPTTDIGSEVIEGIGQVDIMFVPIAGDDVLTPADAEKVALMLNFEVVGKKFAAGENNETVEVVEGELGAAVVGDKETEK
jgi:uncharacterized Zn-binding protein involved in type VI secretion